MFFHDLEWEQEDQGKNYLCLLESMSSITKLDDWLDKRVKENAKMAWILNQSGTIM